MASKNLSSFRSIGGKPMKKGSVSWRQRFLPSLFLLLTIVPVALLLYAMQQNDREADIAADVNASGSLRYRSLWIYDASSGSRVANQQRSWKRVMNEMSAIRKNLYARHPREVNRTTGEWQRFSGSLK